MTDAPAWWIRRKNEHDVDYSQRLRVRGRALQVRLEEYETAVRELVTSSEEVYFGCPPEVADRYNDAYAHLRELSSQEDRP